LLPDHSFQLKVSVLRLLMEVVEHGASLQFSHLDLHDEVPQKNQNGQLELQSIVDIWERSALVLGAILLQAIDLRIVLLKSNLDALGQVYQIITMRKIYRKSFKSLYRTGNFILLDIPGSSPSVFFCGPRDCVNWATSW